MLLSACGPDKRPQQFCDGPSFILVVTAEGGPLPADTRINVRYGSNQKGEPYVLGQQTSGQSVFCEERSQGEGGAGGSPETGSQDVQELRCSLYTQGPAQLDATATGYEPIGALPLSLEDDDRCKVRYDVELARQRPDAGT